LVPQPGHGGARREGEGRGLSRGEAGTTAMETVSSIAPMRALSLAARARGERVGFVPTMGYLHEGHLSLVRLARRHADRVVASIFVNPLQFGANEDLARYPRAFERDAELLRGEGTDVLFFPSVEEMYPEGFQT